MNETRDTLPPGEIETSPHHEIPAPSWQEDMRGIVRNVLRDELRTLVLDVARRVVEESGIREVVKQLEGSLDLAVQEMRLQNGARKFEIREIDGRVDLLGLETSSLREKVTELEAGREADRLEIERLRLQVNEQAAELARWAALGGPPS